MLVFFTIADLSAIDMLFVSIPESLGLLAFGVALVATALVGRWLFAQGEESKDEKEISKKAEVR